MAAVSCWNSEPFRCGHKNFLLKYPIQEGSFDIKLFMHPVVDNCKSYKNSESFIASDWGIKFIIVYALNLRETFCDKSSFEAGEVAFCICFDSKYPAGSNKFAVFWSRYDFPDFISFK